MQTPLGAKQIRHQVAQTQPLLVRMRTLQQIHWHNTQEESNMTKEEALSAIKLLSALESWSFSLKATIPDYLHEDLQRSMEVLEKIVLEEKKA
jgi:hypothetical protein